MISYTFILRFPKHLKPSLITISSSRRSKWDSQLCVLPKVVFQLANIAIKIQYTWLVSAAHSTSQHRFWAWCAREMGRMIFSVFPTSPSYSVASLLFSLDCISTSFPSHHVRSGRILSGSGVRMRSVFPGWSQGPLWLFVTLCAPRGAEFKSSQMFLCVLGLCFIDRLPWECLSCSQMVSEGLEDFVNFFFHFF